MNVRIILLSVLCTGLSLALCAQAAKIRLAAKPVLFFDVSIVWGVERSQGSFEHFDLAKNNQDINIVYEKLRIIKRAIAKRLGACAIVDYHGGNIYDQAIIIDPAYDITRKAIDQLNKEYLARK